MHVPEPNGERISVTSNATPALGARCISDGRCEFLVWAPDRRVELRLLEPEERVIRMEPAPHGYHQAVVDNVRPGALYVYRLDGESERPDPAARYQPRGVHGPSQIIDTRFDWSDDGWTGVVLGDYVLYEMHIGTFTREGTFDAAIQHLDYLRELGATAIEIMPVAQFPGRRNWGYDGVQIFAPQSTYGGPEGLRRLVDACHARGLAVTLDVVYNHLGPEGNYLWDYGPYFTDKYRTFWGSALNFDGPGSDEVRRFFIENALHWISEYHIDSLRLDAVHAIFDNSARPFLRELADAIHEAGVRLGRRVYLFPETDLNDPRLVSPAERGGYGLDAQWNDDFHHAVHAALTGERDGYYADYGSTALVSGALAEGYVFTGQRSGYRGRRHGVPPDDLMAEQFIVFIQNHDQTGNRMLGERLGHIVPFEALKTAAAVMLLSPYTPLIFMGEEYGETAPFLYFIDHSDPGLIDAVRRGRRDEFSAFAWKGETPDPQAEETFERSRLDHSLREGGSHASLLAFYRELLRLRRQVPALACRDRTRLSTTHEDARKLVTMVRRHEQGDAFAAFNLGQASAISSVPEGRWRKLLDSTDGAWGGDGGDTPAAVESDGGATFEVKAHSVVLYLRDA